MSNRNKIDLTELREALGTIIASYTYLYDPYAILKECDIVIRYETAMLDAMGKWDSTDINIRDKVTGKPMKYSDLLGSYRKQWASALDIYNQSTGDWKDSWIRCSEIMDNLMRIAVKEELVTLSKDMFNLSSMGFASNASDSETLGNGGL